MVSSLLPIVFEVWNVTPFFLVELSSFLALKFIRFGKTYPFLGLEAFYSSFTSRRVLFLLVAFAYAKVFTKEEVLLLSSLREFEVAAWKDVLELRNCEMSLCPMVVESCPNKHAEVG
jgi:hypothetical protein